MKTENDLKSCLTSVILYFIGLGLMLFCFFALGIWQERNPVKFCDEIEQNKINTYEPKACKLRYPILNTDEIKRIKSENKELHNRVRELEIRLDDVKDVLENGKEDNWEPDPIQYD